MPDRAPLYAVEPEPEEADRLEQLLVARLHTSRTDAGTDRPKGPAVVELVERTSVTPRRRDRRPLVMAFAAACLTAIAVTGIVLNRGLSSTENGQAPSPIEVNFELIWPDLQGLEQPRCLESATAYESAENLRCFRSFDSVVTLTGDIDGAALWTMAGNVGEGTPGANDATVVTPAAFNGTYIVKATIPGCGTGEFMIAELLRFDGWEAGAFSGTWSVVPGSGRDDLASLAGGGAVPGDRPDSGTDQAARTGQITC